MAAEFGKHWQFLANPGDTVFDLALVQRGQRMISAREEQRKEDRARACSHAMTAFHEKRYADAVKLLTPFEVDEDLSPSARKILSMARRQIGG